MKEACCQIFPSTLLALTKLVNKKKKPSVIYTKNRGKAIFNWAAKGLFFLRGGAAIHTQATIKPCRRPLRETESHVGLKHKLIQNIVPL